MKKYPLFLFSLSIWLMSCQPEKSLQKVNFFGEAQGTYYAVTYFDPDSTIYQTQIDSLLRQFDQSVSLWVKESVISRINRNDPDAITDEVFIELFNRSGEIYTQTDGAFDPTIGPLVNAWGFGFNDRMKIDQAVIDSLLPLVGFDQIKLENNKVVKNDNRIHFDFNAIAQGYSVDLVGKFLESKGIKNYLVDIGGEIFAKETKPDGSQWLVGIEKPAEQATSQREIIAKVGLKDRALATSGNYRKFFIEDGVRYSHTIDPATGYPVQHTLLSATVIADDCATADAFATSFMIMGLEDAKQFLLDNPALEGYFIYGEENGELNTWYSKGFEELLTQ